MAYADWAREKAASTVTEDDRLAYTAKLVERAFGRPVEDVGRVELVNGAPALVVSFGGKDRVLTWARQSSGAIYWYADGDTAPIVLGDQIRAGARLAARLGGE